MRTSFFIVVVAISLSLISCQKEADFDPGNPNGGGGSGPSILGEWKFIQMQAKTKVTGVSGMIKSVTVSDYTTTNNAGTFVIEASKITAKDIAYSINTTATGYFYENNILIDSIEMPIVLDMPSATASYPYKRVSADSIYLEKGLFTDLTSGGSTQTLASGAKIKFDGNKMIWTIHHNNTYTQTVNGTSLTRTDQVTTITTFQKP